MTLGGWSPTAVAQVSSENFEDTGSAVSKSSGQKFILIVPGSPVHRLAKIYTAALNSFHSLCNTFVSVEPRVQHRTTIHHVRPSLVVAEMGLIKSYRLLNVQRHTNITHLD